MNLKDLSNLLGISQTTISRALNDFPEVSEKTRIRVKEAAAKHNYHPNAGAKGLATGRTMRIGHVIPVSTRHEIVNPIFSDFISGAGEVYSRHGYDLQLTVVPDVDEEQVYRTLASRKSVDGVIIHSPIENDPRIKLLQDVGLPFVSHGRAVIDDVSYNWVDVDNKNAFERATQYLIDLGHKRISLINGRETLHFAQRRRAGFEKALSESGLYADPTIMHNDEMTEINGYSAAMDVLNSANPPTAILVSSMITAIGARRAVSSLGKKLGKDVSIVTFDDDLSYLRNGRDAPIFTSVMSSVHLAGAECAQMLLDIIRSPGQPPKQHLLEAELTIGGSTGPAPR